MERVTGQGVVRRGYGDADEDRRDPGHSLPWLESADDHLDRRGGGGRFWRFFAILLVLAALIGGGTWYYRSELGVAKPDGSLIRAEGGPYKVRPEQPGGKTFAGTGDSAYAVSEGQFRQAALGEATGDAATTEASNEPGATGPAVQLGAYMDRQAAETGWSTLVQRNPILSGMSHRIVQGRADTGSVYRLQAVSSSAATAHELCRTLKQAGADCYVKE